MGLPVYPHLRKRSSGEICPMNIRDIPLDQADLQKAFNYGFLFGMFISALLALATCLVTVVIKSM